MKSVACLVLTAALAGASVYIAPAFAAEGEPQLDRRYLRYSGATRALRQFITCAVAADDAEARKVFSHPYRSEEQMPAMNAVVAQGVKRSCPTRSMRITGMGALGAVAETLLRRDQMPAPLHKLNARAVSGGGSFTWTSGRVSDEQELLHLTTAFCLVDTHPARVAQVLSSDETTNAERQLFNASTAEIRSCVPNGTQQTLQPTILRSALAIAYHYASRPVDVSPSAGAANDQNAQAGER